MWIPHLQKLHCKTEDPALVRYRVQYGDGDKEDLSITEVQTHLLPSFHTLVSDHALLVPQPYS